MQDALLDEEGAVPEASLVDKHGDDDDGLTLHSMPHQARAAPANLNNQDAHEVSQSLRRSHDQDKLNLHPLERGGGGGGVGLFDSVQRQLQYTIQGFWKLQPCRDAGTLLTLCMQPSLHWCSSDYSGSESHRKWQCSGSHSNSSIDYQMTWNQK